MDNAVLELGGLGPLLRTWRAEAGQALGLGRPLTQQELAKGVDVSVRWYRMLEAGEPVRPTRDQLDRISKELGLDHARTATLVLYTSGQMPVISQGLPHTVQSLSFLLDQLMPAPAWISDSFWNVLQCNESAAGWFPWMREPGNNNLVRWFLLSIEARTHTLDWSLHAADFLGLLRFAYALHSDVAEYQELLADVLADPDCLALWEAQQHVTASRSGTKFAFTLPVHDHQRVDVLAHFLHPADDPTHRIAVLTQVS
jgi:transcriptional regulator with XRE-family HTH domain